MHNGKRAQDEAITTGLPPLIQRDDKVVLFDGVCRLCNGWSRFLIERDRQAAFKLCTVQSPEGQAILAWFALPTDCYDTMRLVEGGNAYRQSDAFLRVMAQLPKPWCFLLVLKWVPAAIRNWIYDRIALNRYHLFGRYQQCLLPSKAQERRFLHGRSAPHG